MHPALSAVFLLFLVFVPFPHYSPDSVPLQLITSDAASFAPAASSTPVNASVSEEKPSKAALKAAPPKKPVRAVPPKKTPQKKTEAASVKPAAPATAAPSPVEAPPPAMPPAQAHVEAPKPDLVSETPLADDYVSRLERAVHEKINAERASRGIGALGYDTTLAAVADRHSGDMLSKEYFAHKNQEGCDPFCRIKESGYVWSTAGENIFWMEGYDLSLDETAALIVKSWMDSPGHRENILNAAFAEEGIGIAIEGKKVYATENFGTPR